MNNTVVLLLLSLGMWAGSILSGVIPTVLPKSPKAILVLSLLGAGLLFGVAVGVLIPEAIIYIYGSKFRDQKSAFNNIEDLGKF